MKPEKIVQLGRTLWDVVSTENEVCAEVSHDEATGFYFVRLAGDMECEHFRTLSDAFEYALGGEA